MEKFTKQVIFEDFTCGFMLGSSEYNNMTLQMLNMVWYQYYFSHGEEGHDPCSFWQSQFIFFF